MAEQVVTRLEDQAETKKGVNESSESEIDVPVLATGKRRSLTITTYQELHCFVEQLVAILEEVFEMGITKGTAKRYHLETNDDSSESDQW